MSATSSADFAPIVSRNRAREAFRDALRLYIGRGKRYSVKQAANGSGVHPRMIESFVAPVESLEYRQPPLEDILSLSSFLGPEFTSEWLHLSQQGAFLLPDVDEPPPGEIAAENAEDNATITRAAMDGRFDHHERPTLREVGVRQMARGAQLARIGRAA